MAASGMEYLGNTNMKFVAGPIVNGRDHEYFIEQERMALYLVFKIIQVHQAYLQSISKAESAQQFQ
jgi:hypothetical protein